MSQAVGETLDGTLDGGLLYSCRSNEVLKGQTSTQIYPTTSRARYRTTTNSQREMRSRKRSICLSISSVGCCIRHDKDLDDKHSTSSTCATHIAGSTQLRPCLFRSRHRSRTLPLSAVPGISRRHTYRHRDHLDVHPRPRGECRELGARHRTGGDMMPCHTHGCILRRVGV
jgi:hypothetical protein